MTSTGTGSSLPPNFMLTPQQQSLLFAALNSNKPQDSSASAANNPISLSPTSFKDTPVKVENQGFQESPYLDGYDYEFGDESFDFSFAGGEQPESGNMIGDLPGTAHSDSTENEGNDKRSHPDDDDDEEDSPGNGAKRRESSEKIPKKPGRKPLTSEPSSKRKAQNRAAQRAFRERKEKHLKDLETKVEELEKASDAANNENSMLRAQVDRMNTELKQYKQKLAVMSGNKRSNSNDKPNGYGTQGFNTLNDVNFQFEFPKFGVLPGPSANKPQRSSTTSASPMQNGNGVPNKQSPARAQSKDSGFGQQRTNGGGPNNWTNEDLMKYANMFTPSMSSSTSGHGNGSTASLETANLSSFGGNTSSPSASSNSNVGPSSSCGTSPEPFTQSPMGFKPVETMTTIGEEQPTLSTAEQPFAQFTNVDLGNGNLDWLAQQNGGQFDPQLFGGYRESQDNVLSNTTFDDLFNDSLDADFFAPYNAGSGPDAPKLNLIDQIDAKQNAVEDDGPKKDYKNCNQIWEKLQSCDKAQNGELDIDGLCSELTQKAKCSGSGPVVGETDFNTILYKYMGKEVSSRCVADKLGIELHGKSDANGHARQ